MLRSKQISATELAQGKVLMCCASALEDAEIEYQTSTAARSIGEYTAHVVKMEKLTHDVMRVLLGLPPGQQITFKAGQYINILLEDGQRRAFSFANPPYEAEFVELQKTFADSARSWSLDIENIDKTSYDLSVKNPAGGEEITHRSPQDILDEIAALDLESADVLARIRGLLNTGVSIDE